jgi:hypothetical protein
MRGANHLGPVGLNIKEVGSLPLDGELDDLCIYDGSWYRHDGADWVQISGASSGLADPGGNGVVVRTALDTTTARTITGGTSITVSDGDGVAGNPTISRAALTGDVTASADSNATTIAANAVTNSKLAQMPTLTLKGNDAVGAADPQDLTAAEAKSLLAIAAGDVSGLATVATSGAAADVSGLAAIATSGSASDLSAGTIPDARMPDLTGDVTTSAGAVATTIANDAVTYAKMQDISTASKLLGRGDSGAGDPQEITLGSGLSMSGTTLSAAGGSLSDGD